MVRIGIDIMGGDNTPQATTNAVVAYAKLAPANTQIFAIGEEDVLPKLDLQSHNNIVPIASKGIIGMNEHPTKAFKEKPQNSIAVGYHLLKENKIDALISAGNTGAMLVGAHFSIKTIEGILRPAIGAVFPRLHGGQGIMCDVGLNADCKPEHLVQFATLSNVFAKEILQINNPKVGLMNIGEEEGKGNTLTQETYKLLKNTTLNFIGNIEGRDTFSNKADVMVCDGFTGNVVLKMAEQLYDIAQARGITNDSFFNSCHFETYGGSPILGLSKPVIIGHGISEAKAFVNMLHLAHKMVNTDVMGKMTEAMAK